MQHHGNCLALVVALLGLAGIVHPCADRAFAQERSSAPSEAHKSSVNLYLMRNLEHTFNTWKPPSTPPDELGIWVFVTRNRLNALKTMAESYRLDEDVIRAYGDVLVLLKDYEHFLKDIVYFDLIENIARPEQKGFLVFASSGTGVVESTFSGAKAGGAVGTIIPGIGNVVGAFVGGVAGGGASLLRSLDEYYNDVDKDERINALVKSSKLRLIDQLRLNVSSTQEKLKILARILGGEKKYGWGSQVGFDGSESRSTEEQLRLRPNDAFLYAKLGVAEANSRPTSAARSFAKAASFVPADFDVGTDILDQDRCGYLLTAARLALRARRTTSGEDLVLPSQILEWCKAARDSVKSGDANWPRDLKFTYAQANAIAGRYSDADELLTKLLRQTPDDASVYYECACVKSMMGDSNAALEHLRRSFQILPRWQPNALNDVRLKALVAEQRTEVEHITANPLIGKWQGSDGLVLEFFLDGAMRQTKIGKVTSGRFEEAGRTQLTFKTAESTKNFTFSVNATDLVLEGEGKKYQLSRSRPPLVATWKYGSNDRFEFREDGTWRREYGSVVTTGTYSIIPSASGGIPVLSYVRDNALLGETEKRAEFRVTADTLRIRPSGDSKWYDYSRK
ncbi:MAG: tetratricopeptide repeat protein [Planctomycetaceae bacterium]